MPIGVICQDASEEITCCLQLSGYPSSHKNTRTAARRFGQVSIDAAGARRAGGLVSFEALPPEALSPRATSVLALLASGMTDPSLPMRIETLTPF